MNYCNFAKVLIARNTKDPQSIEWWNLFSSDQQKKWASNSLPPSSSSFNNIIVPKKRYEFYTQVMHKYPKMYLPYNKFVRQIPRLQNYLTKNVYYKNSNKAGEKKEFLNHFSLQNWCTKLGERERKLHQLVNCPPCESQNLAQTVLHSSASENVTDIVNQTTELAHKISQLKSPKAEEFISVLEPIIEQKFKTSMKSAVSKQYNLAEKITSEQKQKQNLQQRKDNKEKINEIFSENSNNINVFLSTGKSFRQLNNERLSMYYETDKDAKSRTQQKITKLKEGKIKRKSHAGRLDGYTLKKDEFLNFLKAIDPGSHIIWRSLAIRFQLRNKNGNLPHNAGQVLKEVAAKNGINTSTFNTTKRVSGRDYFQRVRRAKKRIWNKITMPTPKPVRKLQQEIKQKILNKELYIGEEVVPKTFHGNKITQSGELQNTNITVYGRKIPLSKIRKQMFQDQLELLRPITSDEEYTRMEEAEIKESLGDIDNEQATVEELQQKLKKIDRTRSLKMWHDHSEILNHSYISFMISTLYDPKLFITNREYKCKFPERSPIDVQATIEKPYLYILGQSKSTDVDQLSYTSSRIEDLMQLPEPIEINGVPFFDVIRAFSGDGPARQFESGQQRGGNFSCLCGMPSNEHSNLEFAYSFDPPSIAERFQLYKGGCLWTRFSLDNPSPFHNLKKEEIIEELEARNIYMYECNKTELQKALQTELHGVQRPPALLCTQELDIDDLAEYEIPACEPLHDITNVVQNLITELPAHFSEKSVQKEFEHFSSTTIGDKNQIRGADSRLYAIKLAKFVSTLFQSGKVSEEVFDLCTALVEITHLCYMHCSQRTPKHILRLYNQTFKFSYLCKSVIGVAEKMSERTFYGSHFHSLTVHAPQTNRLFCLRSLIPEQEERTFGDLRSISLNTSNRQCGKIIDNAMLRFNAKQRENTQMDYTKIQESIVSNQAKFLPPSEDTKFPLKLLKTRPTLFQKHCERIADYLLLGEGKWWSLSGSFIVFHDGFLRQSLQEPRLPRLGSITSQKHTQILKISWKTCIENFISKELPLLKLKVYADGSLQKVLKNEGKFV